MSLSYDLSTIPLETRTITATADRPGEGIRKGDTLMSPVTNTLIISTMIVGIGHITDATVNEFVARLEIHQKLHGALMHGYDSEAETWVDMPLTREHVEAHMGLKCNVTYETRTKWVARMVTKHRDLFPHAEKG